MNTNTTHTTEESHTYTFSYKGITRIVSNAVLKGDLVVGFEIFRGKPYKGAVKAFRRDRIEGDLKVVA